MAATKTLNFDIFGRDRTASKALKGVGAAAGNLGRSFAALGGAIAAVVSIRSIVNFGRDSVEAFVEAEKSQRKLLDAFERFPALADTNIAALQRLNKQLMLKTGIDDDASASAQAVLAQYNLTGNQIEQLTPLLQDFARKTDQDVTTAAESLGKALLGQGRALKAVGIDFQDTGTIAGNFDQLIAGLTEKVGGYAEVYGTTAAGKFDILNARFGEMQEQVGEALLPALSDLADFAEERLLPVMEDFAAWLKSDGIPGLRDFTAWVSENGPLVVGLGAATVAMWGLNAAMLSNPVGWVVAAIAAQIAIFAAFWNVLTMGTGEAGVAFQNLGNIVSFVMNNGVIAPINAAIGLINGLIDGIQRLTGINLGRIATIGYMGYTMNTGMWKNTGATGVRSQGQVSGAKPFATGGLVRSTPGGVFGQVGEGPNDEVVLPLSEPVLASIGKAIAAAAGPTGGMPPIYVENPFTGEYLLAKVSEVADSRVKAQDRLELRRTAAGFGGVA